MSVILLDFRGQDLLVVLNGSYYGITGRLGSIIRVIGVSAAHRPHLVENNLILQVQRDYQRNMKVVCDLGRVEGLEVRCGSTKSYRVDLDTSRQEQPWHLSAAD